MLLHVLLDMLQLRNLVDIGHESSTHLGTDQLNQSEMKYNSYQLRSNCIMNYATYTKLSLPVLRELGLI